MNKAHSRYGEGPSSRQTEPADYRMIFSYQIRNTDTENFGKGLQLDICYKSLSAFNSLIFKSVTLSIASNKTPIALSPWIFPVLL